MYMIDNKTMQDQIYNKEWLKDWIWCIARVLLDKFRQLNPPSTEAWSRQWNEYIENLPDTLTDLLPKLSFSDVNEEWQWRLTEKERSKDYQEWGRDMDLRWELIRPLQATIEVLTCLFAFRTSRYGTYDYEFLGFSHQDVDELFGWTRGFSQ